MAAVFPSNVTASPEFGDDLMRQLQALSGNQLQQSQQGAKDITSRDPLLAGAQQYLMRANQQNSADSLQRAKTGLQQQGLQSGLEDRNLSDEYRFLADQANLDRQSQSDMQSEALRSQQTLQQLMQMFRLNDFAWQQGGTLVGMGLS